MAGGARVALPLKGVECRFDVTGSVASVELDQINHQNASKPLDCTYAFPLPAGAAVYRCELHVNDRVIRAKVEEEEKARKIYREQKAKGHRAALVETERENLFTLSLGNVQPDAVIVVRFAWFQVLDRNGDGLRLMVPTCPGVRYIPGKPLLRGLSGRGVVDDTDQVPDASRITPPRIDSLHPDAAYFSIQGRLSSSNVEDGTASSPTHPIFVGKKDDALTVGLAGHDAVPDRDFVLAWSEPKAKQLVPQAWHWNDGQETYALVQLRAPEEVKVAENYAQDFYFLVDRSGSMHGAKWQRSCQALHAFVKLLGAEDRVWITLFESNYRDFAEKPWPAPRVLADSGFRGMESLATGGGTELLPAAKHVLMMIADHSGNRRTTVVLITDGQVGNEEEIASGFKLVPHVTVHTFGIDTAVNDACLKSLARQHWGGCWLQTPNDDIEGTIAALGDRLRRPVLTDLSIQGSWEAGSETLPDLHAREFVTVALRGKSTPPLKIVGRLPDGSEHCFDLDLSCMGSKAIKLLWAKQRIASFLESGKKKRAIALAKQHNLICEGAAFIVWDEAEQVVIAEEEVVQPALVPTVLFSTRISMSPAAIDKRSLRLSRMEPNMDLLDESNFSISKAPRPKKMKVAIETIKQERLASSKHDAEQAAARIRGLGRELDDPEIGDRIDRIIQQAMGGSPEVLAKFATEASRAFHEIMDLRQRFVLADVPGQVFAGLFSWAMENGTFDQDRLHKIRDFLNSFARLPFSAGSKERHWRAFLASTVGTYSRAIAVANQWLPELEFQP